MTWAHIYLLRVGARGALTKWLTADDGQELLADDTEQLTAD